MTANRLFVLALVAVTVVASGCQPSTRRNIPVEYVEGTITMDGTPLDNTSVQFIPKKEGVGIESAGGYTDASGKYTLSSMNGDPGKGALVGDYNVFISKTISVPVPGARQIEGEPPEEESQLVTPAIYKDRSNPQLEATVVKGKNTFNFDLKSKP